MFDLHNHTLPGVDDGAKSMQEALEMAAIAAREGIQGILLTPHHKDVAGLLQDGSFFTKVEEFRQEVKRSNIPLQIFEATENAIEPDLPEKLKIGLALPVNKNRYVLVELPPPLLPPFTDDTLFKLQLGGYTPILVHPERCAEFQRDRTRLERLVERGMLVQVTASSLTGEWGSELRSFAGDLLRHNLAHIIASDAHRPTGHRSPTLSRGVAAAASIVGEERARAMVTTVPEAILAGKRAELPEPVQKKRRLFFWK